MTNHTPNSLRSRASNPALRSQLPYRSASMAATPPMPGVQGAMRYPQIPAPSAQNIVTICKTCRRYCSGSMSAPGNLQWVLCKDCEQQCMPSPYTLPAAAQPSEYTFLSPYGVERHVGEFPLPELRPTQDEDRVMSSRSAGPETFTKPFCDFLTENPTVFHAVAYFEGKLEAAGFKKLPARDDWTDKIAPGGKYFVSRNGSSIISFSVGKKYKPGNGVAMIAGHIDALTARLKPISAKPTKAGYVQLGVAPYAGGLNETWWDRDLSIGGRVIVRDSATGKTAPKLVNLGWPIAKIPTLAPHFGVGMMGTNNKETQAVPIIGLDGSDSSGSASAAASTSSTSFISKQPPKLVKLIVNELGLKSASEIINWELELYDGQPATVLGMDKEFISAGRIDDKLCSWAALTGLLTSEDKEDDGVIRLVGLFDDEEIGSLLRQGARGNFLPITVERIVEGLTAKANSTAFASAPAFGPGLMGQTWASSFLLSADVTHAVHPNFTANYLEGFAPQLNVGLTICSDSNGHMTTDSVSTAILDRIAEISGCVNQRFQIRNDSRSGGTVGPMLSSAMGVRAADAGLPQLSMHSVRATTGALDPGLGVKFFRAFLEEFERVDGEWSH